MSTLKAPILTILFSVCFFSTVYITYQFFYYRELMSIRSELNDIENVEVLDIWGHDDVTLEEISARIKIKGKGEMVLHNLSDDVNNYPDNVVIGEIGGFSFTTFNCYKSEGLTSGSMLDIGNKSLEYSLFRKEFRSVNDIINHYSYIVRIVDSLHKTHEKTYLINGSEEMYLVIHQAKSVDKDTIYNLFGIEEKAGYAKTLQWKYCIEQD